MASAIVSIIIFAVPLIVFLAVQFFAQAGRQRRHWPQPPGEPKEKAAEPQPLRTVRRRRVRTASTPSCGRHVTHALLTVVGARESCRYCAAIERPAPTPISDIVAEAERIANEAQD